MQTAQIIVINDLCQGNNQNADDILDIKSKTNDVSSINDAGQDKESKPDKGILAIEMLS